MQRITNPPVFAQQPRRLASRKRHWRPLINLTPLIDVVFILLIFFMLASSLLDWRAIDLGMPAPTAAGVPMEGALLVEVRVDGVRLSGETVSLNTLEERVRERVAWRPDLRVLVKPADVVVLQEAIQVLDRLAAAGVADLSLIRDAGG